MSGSTVTPERLDFLWFVLAMVCVWSYPMWLQWREWRSRRAAWRGAEIWSRAKALEDGREWRPPTIDELRGAQRRQGLRSIQGGRR